MSTEIPPTAVPRKMVLIVDDDLITRELFAEYLRDNGFGIVLAENGKTALKLIDEKRPDIILLDVVLPDMSGYDVINELKTKQQTANIPIIMCTANNSKPEDKIKGFKYGADDYLIKPFELAELHARMLAVMRRSQTTIKPEMLKGIYDVLSKKSEEVPLAKPSPVTIPANIATPPIEEITPFESTRSEKIDTKSHQKKINLFHRIWEILVSPKEVFKSINPERDFLISLLIVFLTPFTDSLAQLFKGASHFDAWISSISLGLVINAIMWIGIGGILTLVLPFFGRHLEMKEALILSGISWVPRLLGAILTAIYGSIQIVSYMLDRKDFSAGIDLIPYLPNSSWVQFFSQVSVFDLWSTWLILLGMWHMIDEDTAKWNIGTIIIGVICLAFGTLTTY
ncbi:MAG: response regulator [Elusimicrobiota bacterium]